MGIKINKEMRNDIALLHFKGDLLGGSGPADKLQTEVKKILDDGIKKVIFDLENVKRMNSTGLGILMRNFTTLKNNDADLKLVCLNESVQGVMVLTKMNTVFDIFRTMEGAVRNF